MIAELAKNKDFRADEFNVDLSKLVRDKESAGKVSLDNARDPRNGVLLWELDQRGYYGYIQVEGVKLMTVDLDQVLAESVIESLRRGVPPRRGASLYATGTDFVEKVRDRHLSKEISAGKIRFVGGSWGAGKTHFFRLLREHAFEQNLLVSTVELSSQQTPFNKFERVFFEILRNIASPTMYRTGDLSAALPFGEVLREVLDDWTEKYGSKHAAIEALASDVMEQTDIDIDFRRIVVEYWKTFEDDGRTADVVENIRGTLLQWFEGEGQATALRRDYGVQKMVKKENARIFLASLGKFVRWLGFRGLLVLLDESEMSHSTMSKSNLKQAHNNLLHLINEAESVEGLILLYAAVPEFFDDPKFGIKTYGALAQRIGALEAKQPKSLDKVWNIDYLPQEPDAFAVAAGKIRAIYEVAYADEVDSLPSQAELGRHIQGVIAEHPEFSHVSSWRVAIKATVEALDLALEGDELPTPVQHHKSIVSSLADD